MRPALRSRKTFATPKEPALTEKPTASRTPSWVVTAAIALLVAMAAALAWSLVEPRTLQVVENEISSPDVAPAFDGARIVYLCDVHAGRSTSRARVAQVVDRVMELNPDVILLGGDNVGDWVDGAEKFYPEAARLSAPLGVFAVLGNHDIWEGVDEATAGFAGSGIKLLDNSSARLTRDGQTIVVAGIDDLEGSPDFSAASAGIRDNEFAVLISHSPDPLVDMLPTAPKTFDLALSGHTHGGQLTVFGLWAPMVNSRFGNRYRTGWHTIADTPTLVSSGIGMVVLPLRFGAPPQLHVITLRRDRSQLRPASR